MKPALPGVCGEGFESGAFKGGDATAFEAEDLSGGEGDGDGAEREGTEEVEEVVVVVVVGGVRRGSFGILRMRGSDVERVAGFEHVAEMEGFDW